MLSTNVDAEIHSRPEVWRQAAGLVPRRGLDADNPSSLTGSVVLA